MKNQIQIVGIIPKNKLNQKVWELIASTSGLMIYQHKLFPYVLLVDYNSDTSTLHGFISNMPPKITTALVYDLKRSAVKE